MKQVLLSALLAGSVFTSTSAAETKIGAAMMAFDNQFQTLLRLAIEEAAKSAQDVSIQFEDGKMDTTTQVNQVANLVAAGVNALIVSPIDAQGTAVMTKAATDAGIPLVYVNNRPAEGLPDKGAVFVGSNETEAGTLQMKEVCRLMGGKGDLLIIMGGLAYEQTRMRTGANEEVLKSPECSGIKVIDKQAGDWSRTSGIDLMTNWLTAGTKPRAVVANNDDMAMGAVQALKAAGMPVGTDEGEVIVAGIDAIEDARKSIADGEMAATVFQDAVGQGKGAFEAAVKMAKGEPVEKEIWIPFEVVNAGNISKYMK